MIVEVKASVKVGVYENIIEVSTEGWNFDRSLKVDE